MQGHSFLIAIPLVNVSVLIASPFFIKKGEEVEPVLDSLDFRKCGKVMSKVMATISKKVPVLS
jgi:hypothetical protein